MADIAKYYKLINNRYHIYGKSGKEVGSFEPGDGTYGDLARQTSILEGLEDKTVKSKDKPNQKIVQPIKAKDLLKQTQESNDKKSMKEVIREGIPSMVKVKKKSYAQPYKKPKKPKKSGLFNRNARAIEDALLKEQSKIKGD